MKNKKISGLFILLCCLMSVTLSGCTDKEAVSKTDFYFDTVVTITLYGNQNVKYIDECFSICEMYENLLSRTKENSEISLINDNRNTYVNVSDDTIDIINKGLYYSDLSKGKFDITLGALSDLWDFESDDPVIPSESDIRKNIAFVDYKKVIVDDNKVMLSSDGAKLDLGGIAKGFIADKLKQYLESKGITSGIIDLGGNILLLGSKPDNTDYNIAIKKPFGKSGENSAVVITSDKSIVSSGNYERYFYKDNVLYHHILDTSTGYPVNNNLMSVTIISDSSTDGDGLSTSCFALGIDDGMELIESIDNVEAVFIDDDYNIHLSSGLKDDGDYDGLMKIKLKD